MIYIIVPFGNINEGAISEKVKGVGESVYDDEAPNAWFVSYDGTTKELADKLEFGDDIEMGEAVIVQVSNYQGFASTSLWDWIRNYGRK